jgi:hypothetical protein
MGPGTRSVWDKGTGRPESVQDRPTRSHEIIYLLSKSRSYFYNGHAIKEPLISRPHAPRNRPRHGSDEKPRSIYSASGATSMGGMRDRSGVFP